MNTSLQGIDSTSRLRLAFMIVALLVITLLGQNAYAQENEDTSSPYGNREVPTNSGDYYTPPQIYVDSVDVQGAGSQYIVNAAIYNGGEDVVGGLQYRVELLSPAPALTVEDGIINDAPSLYDLQMGSQTFAITPQGTEQVSMSYTLPPVPGGEYRLRVQVVTSNGRELGWHDATITAPEAADPYALVTPYRFYLPEFPEERITPLSGPNLTPGAAFELYASATTTTAQTLTPTLEVYKFADSGNILSTTTSAAITTTANTETPFEFAVSAPTEPGVYRGKLYLARDGQRHSTIGTYHWVVRGEGADILSARIIELDNTTGGTVRVGIDFTGPADAETTILGNLKIDILDEQGVAGTFVAPEQLELTSAVTEGFAEVPLSRNIVGTPSIHATITDENGKVLAEYSVVISLSESELQQVLSPIIEEDTTPTSSFFENNKVAIIAGLVGLAVIILIIIVVLRLKSKNNDLPPAMPSSPTTPTPPSTTAALILLATALFGFGIWAAVHAPNSKAQIQVVTAVRTSQSSSCRQWDGWCSIPGRYIEIFVNQPRHNRADLAYDRNSVPFQYRVRFAGCSNAVDAAVTTPLYDKNGGQHSTLEGQNADWLALDRVVISARCPGGWGHGKDNLPVTSCRLSGTYAGYLNLGEVDPFKNITTLQVQAASGREGAANNLDTALRLGYVNIVNVWVHLLAPDVLPSITPAPTDGPITQCTDGEDNDGDGRVDSEDPACHQGYDINAPYDPTRNSENDTECTDQLDNDDDGFENEEDPGCHVDNDIEKDYVPGDNSEANIPPFDPGTIVEED